ncbi:MAG: hypothetical protein K4571_11485 [Deltaproteobacteria bacterium]
MADFLTYIGTWSVLKWVLLVLIAGFIGQFGKMLAEAIMTRVRLRRTLRNESRVRAGMPDEAPGSTPVVSPAGSSAKPAATIDSPDKKSLKIAAKVQKKEAKKKE